MKISILPNASYRFSVTPTKTPKTFFTYLEKGMTLEFIRNHMRPQITKAISFKKNKAGGVTITDFIAYYGAVTN